MRFILVAAFSAILNSANSMVNSLATYTSEAAAEFERMRTTRETALERFMADIADQVDECFDSNSEESGFIDCVLAISHQHIYFGEISPEEQQFGATHTS